MNDVGAPGGLLALLLRPEARVVQLLQHAVVDEYLAAERKAVAVPRLRENHRIEWIGDEADARIHDLLADLVAAALLRERAASFVGRARVGVDADELHEIADRLRLEDHRVAPRLDRDRIARQTRLLDRPRAHLGDVQLLPVRMLGARPSGAGSVGGANGDGVVRVGGPVIREQSFAVGERRGARVHDEVSGRRKIAGFSRGRERGKPSLNKIGGGQVRRGWKPGVDGLDVLRSEVGHRFRIVGRELRQRLRLLHRASRASSLVLLVTTVACFGPKLLVT